MFKYLSEILKSFSPKLRLIVFIIVMLTTLSSIYIKSSFTKSDCSSLQIQIDALTKTQSSIIAENNAIIQKNQELSIGYLKMDSLVNQVKPDTIFIEKTLEIHNDSDRSYVNKTTKNKIKIGSGCLKKIKMIIRENKK